MRLGLKTVNVTSAKRLNHPVWTLEKWRGCWSWTYMPADTSRMNVAAICCFTEYEYMWTGNWIKSRIL